MLTHSDFCTFILSHGRPNNIKTLHPLLDAGNYSGPWYIVIDNEDPTAETYYQLYGHDRVIMFDKEAEARRLDIADNFVHMSRKTITYARNACYGIAKNLGYTYFWQLDDDYYQFRYVVNSAGKYVYHSIRHMDEALNATLDYYKSVPSLTLLSWMQGGDLLGGNNSYSLVRVTRKAMNSFICSTERPIKFRGRMNEDVNTYVSEGNRGKLIMMANRAGILQTITQSSDGGITELYKACGTYTKSMYTVMHMPSAVKVGMMHSSNPRIHHTINWNNCVPKIIRQELKK